MTRHRPKAIFICGNEEDGELVADPCDVCKKGVVRRHTIVGDYTAYACSNDECAVNGTPEPAPVEFKGPLPGEDMRVFRNDAFPRIFIDLNAVYCERCLEDTQKPVLTPVKTVNRSDGDFECPVHGEIALSQAYNAQALANLVTMVVKVPSVPDDGFRFDRASVEMRATTVRKYVAAEWHAITKEEMELLESDSLSGNACRKTAKQMLEKIRLEKGKHLPRSSG